MADACDVRKGLREYMSGMWAGDENLDDGELDKHTQEYKHRVEFVSSLGMKDRERCFLEDISIIVSWLQDEMVFLNDGLKHSTEVYEKKRTVPNTPEEIKMELSWNMTGFEGLIKESKN